jgi:hypothetical protein
MTRRDVGALVSGALIGGVVALVAVLIWAQLSRPTSFPTTTIAALPTPFVAPAPTPRPELPISLDADGLGGVASFGEAGDAVVAELEALLGTSNADEHWTCPDPAGEVRFVQWADLGVFVIDGVFVGWVDAMFFPAEFGPRLELKTVEDLHIGVELEHFEAHLGDRFVFNEPDPNAAENAAREFDIDGPDGIHGYVQDGGGNTALQVPPEPVSVVISLSAGTTCFDNAP